MPHPAPIRTAETAAFWDGTKDGKLLIKHCRSCGKSHWYPRARCPLCFDDATEWRAASGRGVIYAFSVMRRADPPYIMAYVMLEEGPAMMTNLVECDPDTLTIGQPVTVQFSETEGGEVLPCFTPTGDSA